MNAESGAEPMGGGAPAAAGGVTATGGFGVYVHWPFCAQKCPYCDFNSHVRHGGRDGVSGWDEARFVAAYLRELQHFRALTGPRTVGSIFFGGGTPSLMQGATVGRLIDEVARLWQLDAHAEITLEGNPGSVEAGRFRDYRTAGVNRVSLGLQALNDVDLKALGRIHSVAEARKALAIARETFERVSFDLIYARAGQSAEAWRNELAEALTFAPGHLSLYQLTIEPGTMFERLHAAGRLVVPDADVAAAMYEITQDATAAAGLPAYEVSNHARAGEESRHNLVYWRYGDYAGVGPGAHGRLVIGHGPELGPELGPEHGRRIATVTERHPETWLRLVEERGAGITEQEAIDTAAAADELLLMGLRLREGVDLKRLVRVGGVVPDPVVVAQLAEDGLVAVSEDGRRLSAAGAGRFLINRLALELSSSFRPATMLEADRM